jgi:RNA polymerase sigma factor (sigma-70 family)
MHAALVRLHRLVADLAPESDGRLLDAFLAGNESAFRELVRRHGSLVFAVCQRVLRHRQDAEDAFQAVFLVLARRAADVWPRDAVGSWLYGVAYRVALKARTLRARQRTREQPLEDLPQLPQIVPEPDVAEVIDRAVRRLPEVYRAAVVACDLEGLSRKDAAEQLGWKEGTLSGRLARARKLLADRLRKVGMVLPVGGLVGVLGTGTPVRAGLADRVAELALGGAAGRVPASVAILTEGVVQGMFAFNLKAMAAVAVLVCGLTYGAWAAGDGNGQAPGSGTAPAAAGQPPARAKAEAPGKVAPALRPLQGKWRIVTIAEGKTTTAVWKDEPGEIEISGNTLWMPYRAGDGAKKRDQFRIAVDDTKALKEIDLVASGKPVARGIYQFTSPATTCTKCHTTEGLGVTPETARFMALCQPGVQAIDPHHWKSVSESDARRVETRLLEAWLLGKQPRPAVGLRLAIATTGGRPKNFESGAEGVIEFRLERVAEANTDREKLAIEIAKSEELLRIGKTTAEQRAELELELAWLRVKEAKLEQDATRVIIDRAQAQVEEATLQFTAASRKLQEAVARLEEAQKAVAKGGKKQPPGKAGDSFTVHVRPLAAAEKIIRVNATGKETVLEGLTYAAEDMTIKPDALSVWVVRDKVVLPVDLAGITQRGETKTNYVLKPGDQLFVQVKLAK